MTKKDYNIEIISTAFSDHNAIKLEISDKLKNKNIALKNSLLNSFE